VTLTPILYITLKYCDQGIAAVVNVTDN
jgi:hypothetical protein